MDEIVEFLSSKLPLELVNKILYEYGGAQSPTAKLIKNNTVTIYTKPIDYGHAYYARYKGVNYCGGEHMKRVYQVDDIPIAECRSRTFEWGAVSKKSIIFYTLNGSWEAIILLLRRING